LDEAKQYALDNSPILLNSGRDIEIARKKIWENTATGLPQATLDGTYTYSPQLSAFTEALKQIPGFEDVNVEDFKTSLFATIQVNQLIFSGQYIVGLKAAKVFANLSALAGNKSKTGILENITTTYFTALIAKESKTVLDSTLKILLKTLFETEQLYKNGFVESTDVDQLKILISNVRSNLSVTVRQIELTGRLLKFQMGISIDQEIELSDQIEPLISLMDLDSEFSESFDIESNVDYQIMLTQEKLTKLNMQVKSVQYLPTLSGFYTHYEDYDKNGLNDQAANLFGLSVKLPLWTSGQRSSQLEQSRLDYLKAKTNTQMASDNLLIQYETAYSGLLSARDIYLMQMESRNLALRIYQKAILKFTEGVGASLDLNQAQSQYFESEGKYFNALMTLISAKAKLESLLANNGK
jgi:outer membrane protein TolC